MVSSQTLVCSSGSYCKLCRIISFLKILHLNITVPKCFRHRFKSCCVDQQVDWVATDWSTPRVYRGEIQRWTCLFPTLLVFCVIVPIKQFLTPRVWDINREVTCFKVTGSRDNKRVLLTIQFNAWIGWLNKDIKGVRLIIWVHSQSSRCNKGCVNHYFVLANQSFVRCASSKLPLATIPCNCSSEG